VPEALEKLGITVERNGRVDQWAEIEIGFDAARAHHRRASRQHGRFRGVAADRRDDREPVKSLMQGDA
jgi:hypothetical protein